MTIVDPNHLNCPMFSCADPTLVARLTACDTRLSHGDLEGYLLDALAGEPISEHSLRFFHSSIPTQAILALAQTLASISVEGATSAAQVAETKVREEEGSDAEMGYESVDDDGHDLWPAEDDEELEEKMSQYNEMETPLISRNGRLESNMLSGTSFD